MSGPDVPAPTRSERSLTVTDQPTIEELAADAVTAEQAAAAALDALRAARSALHDAVGHDNAAYGAALRAARAEQAAS